MLVLFFFVDRILEIATVIFAICVVFDIVLFALLKNIFSVEIQELKYALKSRKKDINSNVSQIPGKFVMIAILCLSLICTSVAGEARCTYKLATINSSTKDTNSGTSESTTNENKNDVPYDFSNVTDTKEWPNHYFFGETDENTFVENLENSIRDIDAIQPISDKELQIMTNYGTIVEDANQHYNVLVETLLNGSIYILNGPLPNTCYFRVHEIRAKMEETCKTPANRKAIMNCYLLGGLHNLGKNGAKYEYEQAVRYAWGTLYIRIAWGQYDGEDVSNIINSYEHLRGEANQEEIKRIELIVNVLNRLKIRLDENPPNPICTK